MERCYDYGFLWSICSTNSEKLAKKRAFEGYWIQYRPIMCQSCFCCSNARGEGTSSFRTLKLDSGVRIQDIIEGEGQKAQEGDLVEVNYVCRRSNGYFVHSTVDQFSGESSPVILPLDENQIIKGLKEVLIGMKVGGKRRALIPPSVGYINENLKPVPEEFGPRRSLFSHANEPLIFEVQLLKVL
ncbi:peptidyl-prolyl cis-trans isomerase FKBP16-1, chloroplastic isoform X6 [Hevea brasiliensis]|uniref:peptidyl-prolyl cis-trans isomerase FKBP16-1, chloroplastic isoform X6 n=1 Tax=Hevea brasiliensis TaxID=3981 RepID=UPI0025CF6D58|nr:peptidyl-prolyl cis-trans isomerase FKBP16-1, chloroplastic isoform X6 [Hevea brasiliensis]XP_058000478.1 peptidyl-prolyl cis-trans isomerase FKBP16-1, chloroplastic isoform X6 [Hevea brasiliensis]